MALLAPKGKSNGENKCYLTSRAIVRLLDQFFDCGFQIADGGLGIEDRVAAGSWLEPIAPNKPNFNRGGLRDPHHSTIRAPGRGTGVLYKQTQFGPPAKGPLYKQSQLRPAMATGKYFAEKELW